MDVHPDNDGTTTSRQRKCCQSCDDNLYFLIRVLVFTVNVFAWIFSIFFICIGIWILQEKDELGINNLSSDPAILLIVAGCVLFLITFTGCVGTLRENIFLLKLYLFLIVVLFIIEIITGFIAFLFANETEERIFGIIKDGITEYHDDPDSRFIIDGIQRSFNCCGAYTFDDWDHNPYFKCSSLSISACGVPYSCCKYGEMNKQCGYGIRTKDEIEAKHIIYVEGCVDVIKTWFNDHLKVVGALGFTIAAIQLVLILFVNKLIMEVDEISKQEIDSNFEDEQRNNTS